MKSNNIWSKIGGIAMRIDYFLGLGIRSKGYHEIIAGKLLEIVCCFFG
jgi:hypothetical protein